MNGFQNPVSPWSCLMVTAEPLTTLSKKLWFPTITAQDRPASLTGYRVTRQPAFGQIKQGNIKCCA